ncbi:putative receptor-like protein kinase At3g47110 [Malus domestica]|uniref:putative receptor-like protein kinase At3g47110 n=1 Tax=Malus domestica TaxID=3750 RepID=UPI0039748F32
MSSACQWRLEFCSLSLEFDYHRGLQVHACFISKHGALTISHTNFSTDQSALLALKAHVTSDPQNILTANWSFASNSDICNWVGVSCGAGHHRVTALNLSHMGLAGVIPPHLGNHSFLVELGLKNNSFHGPLPQELSRLRRLKAINFGNNSFMGTIPW